ncbi:hypothetical protein OY671_009132, partial [Metschnikowia pulcherrima]
KLDSADWTGSSGQEYDDSAPRRWGGDSPFADCRFTHPGGKAQIIAVDVPHAREADPAFPSTLNTGRYRDQWHTMTRTGSSPRLSQHRREPSLEVHPSDAEAQGSSDGRLAAVRTPHGHSSFRVKVTDAQRPSEVFVPMHWTDRTSSAGRCNSSPGPAHDPVSGQPGFKNSPTAVEPWRGDWRGFSVSAERPASPEGIYWTAVQQDGGWSIESEGKGTIDLDASSP